MFQLTSLLIGVSLFMTTGNNQNQSANGDMGLYLSADDFLSNKLSYPGDCSTGGYKIKPSSFEITGGAIDSTKVKAEFDNYTASFGTDPSVGILDRCAK